MKTAIERLIDTLKARGLRVIPGREPGQLLLNGPDAEKTPAIIEAVKAFKPQLLDRIQAASEPEPEVENVIDEDAGTECQRCKRTWYCTVEEIREAVCNHNECHQPRCPYRTTSERNGRF